MPERGPEQRSPRPGSNPHPGHRVFSLPGAVLASLLISAAFITQVAFREGGRLSFVLFDDAMISMRYARHLVEGHGLVWNPGGSPVEGYSNFLWTLWMAVPHALGLPGRWTSLFVMLSGGLILAATVMVVHAIVGRLTTSPKIPGLAAWLTALAHPLAYWTLFGMEVGLLALLVSGAVLLALRLSENPRTPDLWLLAVLLGAALLTRDDALLPVLVVAAGAVLLVGTENRLRTALVLGTTVLAILGGHALFRVAVYGDALPNTYFLKIAGVSLDTRLRRGAIALLYAGSVYLYAPLLAAAACLFPRSRRPDRRILFLWAIVAVLGGYVLYTGGDAWEWISNRHVAVALPPLLVLTALGVDEILRSGRRDWVVAGLLAVAGVNVLLYWGPASSWLAGSIQAPGGTTIPTAAGRTLVPVTIAVVLLVLIRRRIVHTVAVALTGVVLVAGIGGEGFARWAVRGVPLRDVTVEWAKYGMALRGTTSPGASIAASSTGAIGYFSRRRVVDLLGKSDRHVARSDPATSTFLPGHNKWDYGHSIGQLRPDVIAQVYGADRAALRAIKRDWGYRQIAPIAYVRRDSPHVDAGALEAFLDRRP